MTRNVKNIEDQLRLDEGEVLHAYNDHLGYVTIGIGRLLDKRKGGGISKEESSYLFQNDLKKKAAEVKKVIPWFDKLDEVRQGVLINMAFQMGVTGLLGFENTLAFVKNGMYSSAARNMLKSKWATQTPQRAQRLAKQMEKGEWQ